MAEPALKIEPKPVNIRRFYIADLTTHGPWIMQRLLKAYPNQNERSVIGWLNGVIDQNEYLCLTSPNAVCFAERFCLDPLSGKMLVREKFIWCKDPDNALQQAEAADFYPVMIKWARDQGIDKVIVCERSDVPVEKVREKFTRLHEFKTVFARV
jgi:hypothetical protein